MVLAHHKIIASHTEQAAGLFLRMRWRTASLLWQEDSFKAEARFTEKGSGSSYRCSTWTRIKLLKFFDLWSASAQQCCHGPVSKALLFILPISSCARSKVDDLLQSCQINSGKLRRHCQSLKHLPWPLQGHLQASTCEPPLCEPRLKTKWAYCA